MTPNGEATAQKEQETRTMKRKLSAKLNNWMPNAGKARALKLGQAAIGLEEQEKELCAEFRRGLGSFNQQLAKNPKSPVSSRG